MKKPLRTLSPSRSLAILAFALLATPSCGSEQPEPAGTSSSGASGSGSGGSGTPDSACEPTIESLAANVFGPSCSAAGCHGGDVVAAALRLDSPDAASALVGAASGTCGDWLRVAPGSLEASLLWQKLVSDAPPCGDRMPPGAVLSESDLACVQQWIENLSPVDVGPSCETCGTSACVDLATDPAFCGRCDTSCPAGSACTAGACECAGELAFCGDACVDVQSNVSHCGACGTACASGQVCLRGQCASGCDTLTQCGSSCVDTTSSTLNCGDCGVTCSGGQVCEGGTCQCPGGGIACGTSCVDAQTDSNNCGTCGNTCGAGQTCEAGVCTCSNATASFSANVQPIFDRECASRGCHSGVRPQENLDLTQGNAYGDLVGVPSSQCTGRLRVDPGDPSTSYLMQKLLGVNLCTGSQMPKAGTSLPRASLEAIGAWICNGAENN